MHFYALIEFEFTIQVASYCFVIIPLFVATLGLGAWSFSKIFKKDTGDQEPEIHPDSKITLEEAVNNLQAALNNLNPSNLSPVTSDSLSKFKSACYFYADCGDAVDTSYIEYLITKSIEWIEAKIPKKQDQVRWMLPLLYICTHRDGSELTHDALTRIVNLLPPLNKSSSQKDINLYISLMKILDPYTFSDFNYKDLLEVFTIIEEKIGKIDLKKNKNKELCQSLKADISVLQVKMRAYLGAIIQKSFEAKD